MQMVAMRYGTIPVVRKTGGLADTVFDVDHDEERAADMGESGQENRELRHGSFRASAPNFATLQLATAAADLLLSCLSLYFFLCYICTSQTGLATNGFSFEGTDAAGLDYALNRALSMWYSDRESWAELAASVMQQDWSWDSPALDYLELYYKALKA